MYKSVKLIVLNGLFLFVLTLFSNLSAMQNIGTWPSEGNTYSGAGVLPYSYDRQGHLCFLFAYDSFSRNGVWGDLGGDKIQNDWGAKYTAARCAHEGTMGVFAEKNCYNRVVSWREGQKFWVDNRQSDKMILNEATRYKLFFIKVNYKPVERLREAFINKDFVGRWTGFAWVKAMDLIDALENRAAIRSRRPIPLILKTCESWIYSISLETQRDAYSVINNIRVGNYLTEELASNLGREIIQQIIKEG